MHFLVGFLIGYIVMEVIILFFLIHGRNWKRESETEGREMTLAVAVKGCPQQKQKEYREALTKKLPKNSVIVFQD